MRNTGICLIAIASAALSLAGCSRETADWKSATTADTTEAYQQFLQQHPNSSDSDQARSRLKALAEDHDWQVAAAADTRSAYEQFVAQHADSKWAAEARIRIENFAQTGGSATPAASVAPPSAAASPAAVTPAAAATSAARTVAAVAATAAGSAAHGAKKAGTDKAGKKAASKPPAKVASVGAHGNFVQLGAFHSKQRAQTRWRQLEAKFPTELKSLKPDYVEGASKHGTVYRLRVPVSGAAAAKGLCGTLRKHAQSCVTVTA